MPLNKETEPKPYLRNFIWLEKNSMILGFSRKKKRLKISNYLFDLENITDQFYRRVWSSGWDYVICLCQKIPENFMHLISRTDSGLCIYHLFVWSNFNFLHNSRWITFPTQSCLVLYSFYARLLHSLIMWLMVSSRSPHNLHLIFCCVLLLFFSFCLGKKKSLRTTKAKTKSNFSSLSVLSPPLPLSTTLTFQFFYPYSLSLSVCLFLVLRLLFFGSDVVIYIYIYIYIYIPVLYIYIYIYSYQLYIYIYIYIYRESAIPVFYIYIYI